MKFGLLYIIFIISETNSFHVDDNNFHKDVEEKRVLLRKLQNLQEQDSRNAQTPTWSEILANVLLKRMFSFHKPNNESERVINVEDEKNIWVRSLSFVLKIYKRYLYDKLKHNHDVNKDIDADKGINKDVINKQSEVNLTETVDNKEEVNTEVIDNPNDEVEIIEPKYHGKLCDNCIESGEIESNDCGEDLVKDADGKCVAKSSKFIMSVPPQCPIGYRRDWLGYCRVIL